jgi:mevalonate kinase
MLTVKAPGKLILSGEHAVVYGHPAIVMTVNRYVELEVTPQSEPDIFLELLDLQYQQQISLLSLNQLHVKIKKNYISFKENTLGVKSILKTPSELTLFALSVLLKEYSYHFSNGIKIKIKSSIPISSGMGSSAALILGILYAVGTYLQLNIPLDAYYSMALEAENMQHGISSGIDLLASLQGGCLYRHGTHFSKANLPPFSMYLINTGAPKSSTGECVTHAAYYFKNSRIGDDFAAVTNELHSLFQAQGGGEEHLLDGNLKEIIRENHRLLKTIGVIPKKISCFVEEIEKHGGAAKICGAGSVVGDSAGMMLVFLEDERLLKKINLNYKYEMLPIQIESRGIHVV